MWPSDCWFQFVLYLLLLFFCLFFKFPFYLCFWLICNSFLWSYWLFQGFQQTSLVYCCALQVMSPHFTCGGSQHHRGSPDPCAPVSYICFHTLPKHWYSFCFKQPVIFWASLVSQRLKRLPAMWETWVRSLGQEAPLEKETEPTPAIFQQDLNNEKCVSYLPTQFRFWRSLFLFVDSDITFPSCMKVLSSRDWPFKDLTVPAPWLSYIWKGLYLAFVNEVHFHWV